MSIVSRWIGQRLSLATSAFWAAYFGGETWSGKSVTLKSVLELSTAWACIRVNSQTVGTLPCSAYRELEDGTKVVEEAHPVHYLVHDLPNADFTAVEFWEGIAAGVLTWGNGYALKGYSGARLVALTLLSSGRTEVWRDPDNRRWYRYHPEDGTAPIDYPEELIFHVRGWGYGSDLGLSPIGFARQTMGTAMAAHEAAARVFSSGMRPGGFFLFDHELSPQQRAEAKENLLDPMSGPTGRRKIGLLEMGVKWQDVNMPPDDAQLLQSRGFDVEEICRWFGTPPILVGHASAGQTMWGTGVEQIVLGWVKLGLRPILKRIEMAAHRSLFTSVERQVKKLSIEFNLEALLRGDSAARAALVSTFSQNGVSTRNELRALENKRPLPGGDILTVQANLVPLADVGKVPARRITDGGVPQ